MPPVIPRLYSNPSTLSAGVSSAADEASAVARLSAAAAAGLGGMSGAWSPFSSLNPSQGPGNPGSTYGGASTGFPGSSFPGLFASPLGFHPLDFSAMRLPHSSLSNAANMNLNSLNSLNEMDLKGLDPRAVLSAYMSDLANARNAVANSAQEQVPSANSAAASAQLGNEHHNHNQHHNHTHNQHQPTNQELSFALSQQAERFKAAAAMYGQRFFPYGMRGFLPEQQKNLNSSNTSPRCSPVGNEKASNGASLSPRSSHGGSLSSSPLNSNNNSNISSKGPECTTNTTTLSGGLGAPGTGARRSPGPETSPVPELRKLVEGLHSKTVAQK